MSPKVRGGHGPRPPSEVLIHTGTDERLGQETGGVAQPAVQSIGQVDPLIDAEQQTVRSGRAYLYAGVQDVVSDASAAPEDRVVGQGAKSRINDLVMGRTCVLVEYEHESKRRIRARGRPGVDDRRGTRCG